MSMFIQNVVSKEYVDAHSGASIDAVSAATVASAATIDLTGLDGEYQIDVTGTTTITAITLGDGIEHVLRFTGALTLTQGASLLLPGGVSIATVANDWGIFRGGAAGVGVVTVLNYQNAANYSKQTFDNIFMNSAGQIRAADQFPASAVFSIGRGGIGQYIEFSQSGYFQIRKEDLGNNSVELNMDLLSGGIPNQFYFPLTPQHRGVFLTYDDVNSPLTGNTVPKFSNGAAVNSSILDDGTNTTILGPNGLIAIGDANSAGNSVLLKVDDINNNITLTSPNGTIDINSGIDAITIGDVYNVGHNTSIVVSDGTRQIHIKGDTIFFDNQTTDGFVRTNGGTGELIIDSTTYSTFDGAFTSLTSKPTTIGGYGITDFNSLGDARWQPLDTSATARLNLAIL